MQLEQARQKLGMSQMLLSKKAKVSRYRISQAECGYANLTDRELKAIGRVFANARNKKGK